MAEQEMRSVSDWNDLVRDRVNKRRRHARLGGEPLRYNQVCAAMDLIGDTEMALVAFRDGVAGHSGDGSAYLSVFGALQALYVQQDAVYFLCKQLGVVASFASLTSPALWVESNPALARVRDIRNSSIGHPVLRKHDKTTHFISRMSLHASGFQLVEVDATGKVSFLDVAVLQLVEDQAKAIRTTLELLLGALEEDDLKHQRRFARDRLASVFAGVNYACEKIGNIEASGTQVAFSLAGLASVREAVRQLRLGLEAREEPYGDGMKRLEEHTAYCLDHLEAHFGARNRGEEGLDSRLAYVLYSFVRGAMEELHDRAHEIDEAYQTERSDGAET